MEDTKFKDQKKKKIALNGYSAYSRSCGSQPYAGQWHFRKNNFPRTSPNVNVSAEFKEYIWSVIPTNIVEKNRTTIVHLKPRQTLEVAGNL